MKAPQWRKLWASTVFQIGWYIVRKIPKMSKKKKKSITEYFFLLQKRLIHMQYTSTLYFTFPLRNIHMYSLSQVYTVATVRFMSLWSNLKECDPETKLNIKPGGAVKQQGFAD